MHTGILTDVLKVLGYSLGDADFLNGNTKTLHQRDGIVVGSVCGSESRHSDTYDTLSVHFEFIKSFYTNE